MKEGPILMAGGNPVAIYEGRKTHTRRGVKPQPDDLREYGGLLPEGHVMCPIGDNDRGLGMRDPLFLKCPYGGPGDRLWVKETHYRFGRWEPVAGVQTRTGRQKWKFVPMTETVLFAPPEGCEVRQGRHAKDSGAAVWHQRLARFMPRSASRLTLEIVAVRVERLQEISEADCIAEGAQKNLPGDDSEWDGTWLTARYTCGVEGSQEDEPDECARDWYRDLWDIINGPGSWDENPWVWVVEFKHIPPGPEPGDEGVPAPSERRAR